MENANLSRLENMVAMAQRESIEARHLAETAIAKVTAHERLCSERYNNIANQLKSLPDIYKTLNALSATANKAVGMWLGLTGVSVLIGIIYTLYRISHGG